MDPLLGKGLEDPDMAKPSGTTPRKNHSELILHVLKRIGLPKLHSASRQRHMDEWFHRFYTRLERYPPSLEKHHDQDMIDS